MSKTIIEHGYGLILDMSVLYIVYQETVQLLLVPTLVSCKDGMEQSIGTFALIFLLVFLHR